MSQLTNMQVQIVDGLSVGDQESDCDDDDRRELISHYANDKYLSKWELAEEEEEIEEEQESLDDKEPNIDNSEMAQLKMVWKGVNLTVRKVTYWETWALGN